MKFRADPSQEFGRRLKQRKGISPLDEVLEAWGDEHLKFANLMDGDTIFGNNEISNVSALSTAASKRGWASTIEFTHRKEPVKRGGECAPKKSPGRCDLFLEKDGYAYFAEAKLSELSLDHESDWASTLGVCWNSAINDAEKTKGSTQCDMLAIAFWKFYLPIGKAGRLDDLRIALITHLDGGHFDATAWVFPKVCEQEKWGDGYWYPGAAMALRKV